MSYERCRIKRKSDSGGDARNATYRNHGTHAEAIEIVFDPTKLSYRKLLEYFFQIHDPSTFNRQGNERGTSYRSAIFYTSEEQKRVAEETIADVNASGLWPGKVVTEVKPAGDFWEAEPEHQDYLERYPHGYVPVRKARLEAPRTQSGTGANVRCLNASIAPIPQTGLFSCTQEGTRPQFRLRQLMNVQFSVPGRIDSVEPRFHEGRPLLPRDLADCGLAQAKVYCRGLYQTVLSRDSVSCIAFPVPTSPDVGPSRRAEER